MTRIVVANGVNLDLLGKREQKYYGNFTIEYLENYLQNWAKKLFPLFSLEKYKLEFFQSNDEYSYLTKVSEKWDGALLNPAAWTHTSLALADRLSALSLPYVEVHISNLAKREAFRQHSYCASSAIAVVQGGGIHAYSSGLLSLLSYLYSQQPS